MLNLLKFVKKLLWYKKYYKECVIEQKRYIKIKTESDVSAFLASLELCYHDGITEPLNFTCKPAQPSATYALSSIYAV